MSFATADSFLEVIRITSTCQQLLVIISFQESGMTLTKMIAKIFTRCTDICKDANLNSFTTHHKAVWFACIMQFGKSSYMQVSYCYHFVGAKRPEVVPVHIKVAAAQC